ncbi:unnamed protein product [Allacma fusca]|uniref:Uncharacterized protein n=1 Tax=Allacma fusca TaxID=39272 RepID=A0A8J2PQ14_9HEXA|nr:unnamed protein product [Allacma fusca]
MFSRSNSISIPVSENVPIGIDFGQQSACTCAIQNSKVKIIPSQNGSSRTPCYFSSWADQSSGNWYHDVGHNAKIASIQAVPSFPLREPILSQLFEDQFANLQQLDVNMNHQVGNPSTQKIIPIREIKRLMGRTFDDLEALQGQLPFRILNNQNSPTVEAEHLRWKDQGKTVFPQEVSANLFQNLKETAAKHLQAVVTDCVITVPARFDWFQRLAVKDSAVIAGFEVVHLINESTAATIAYYNDSLPKRPENVLVFDLGSSSLDLTVLAIDGIRIETTAIGGNSNFGGEAFTDSLTEFCLTKFKLSNRFKGTDNFNSLSLAELKNKCEWVKEDLSKLVAQKIKSAWLNPRLLDELLTKEDLKVFLKTEAHIDLLSKEELIFLLSKQVRSILYNDGKTSSSTLLITDNLVKLFKKKIRASLLKNQNLLNRIVRDVKVFKFHEDLNLEVQLSAQDFHKLNKFNVDKALEILNEFLNGNKIRKDQIDRVILAGSSTKIPHLEDMLESYFEDVPISNSINPQVVVAYGAAIQALSMRFIEGDYLPTKKEISEKVLRIRCGFSVPFSIGVLITDPEEKKVLNGDFGVVISRNTQIPCSVYRDFSMTVIRGSCDVKIYVGESNFVAENSFWAGFELKGLPSTRNRKCKIGFTMEVSDGGMLRVNTYCWNDKRIMEGTIVDGFQGRAMKSNYIHVLK